jgi:hypothetical protein
MILLDLPEMMFVSVRKQRDKNALGLLCERASLLGERIKIGTVPKWEIGSLRGRIQV